MRLLREGCKMKTHQFQITPIKVMGPTCMLTGVQDEWTQRKNFETTRLRQDPACFNVRFCSQSGSCRNDCWPQRGVKRVTTLVICILGAIGPCRGSLRLPLLHAIKCFDLQTGCVCSANGPGSWCRRRELNSRPRPYQGRALPLSHCGVQASCLPALTKARSIARAAALEKRATGKNPPC